MLQHSQDPSGPDVLVVVASPDGENMHAIHPLEPGPAPVTVGRQADNTIVLDGDSVSRRHARFERRADGWWVVDDNSTNGTFVDHAQVQEALLRRGNTIRVGDTTFMLFHADDARRAIDPRYTSSSIDRLTEAYNRRHLNKQIERVLPAPGHPPPALALVLFDLDHFKHINDRCGHTAGDHVLREVAALMRKHARPGDLFARYNGEEFALLLPDTNLQCAAALADKLRVQVAAHLFTYEGHRISVTVSAGVALADDHTRTVESLTRAVEKKVHAAKLAGCNRVVS